MKNYFKIFLLFAAALLLTNCSDDKMVDDIIEEEAEEAKLGYAHPDGVFVLNTGPLRIDNGTLTYIAPDGTVETDVYKKVNGTELGNGAVDMYMLKDKIYILCNDYSKVGGVAGDGALIIADAKTLKKIKAYKLEDLKYEVLENMRPNYDATLLSMSNIAVLDEQNVFFADAQALFRLNTTTDKLMMVKGSYHVANGGGSIEPKVSRKSMAVVNDKLYMGTGGFWSDAGVYEFVKNKDEVNRTLSFESGNLISGIAAGQDGNVWVATYSRANQNRNEIYQVSSKSMKIIDSKNVRGDIAPGFGTTSGISLAGDSFYFSGQTTKVQRFLYNSGRIENLVDAKSDEPKANYLNCNMVVNKDNHHLYIATSEENIEGVKTHNNVLIYDCSGDKAVLKQNIADKTSYAAGIYPVSKFYKK